MPQPPPRNTRGEAYRHLGQYDKALADLQTAVKLAPAWAGAHNDLAWLLATCPDAKFCNPTRAVELAQRGCELTHWRDANILDTLASAYAECGRFDEAVAWANKALELADAELKEAVGKHIELFRNGRPARS